MERKVPLSTPKLGRCPAPTSPHDRTTSGRKGLGHTLVPLSRLGEGSFGWGATALNADSTEFWEGLFATDVHDVGEQPLDGRVDQDPSAIVIRVATDHAGEA
jgi:hypothetical protein